MGWARDSGGRPSRGSTMAAGAGGSTHKTGKHVISPRRGERRGRGRSRAVLFFFFPFAAILKRSSPPAQASLGRRCPFLTQPFLPPPSAPRTKRVRWCFLLVRISATAKYPVVTCLDFLSPPRFFSSLVQVVSKGCVRMHSWDKSSAIFRRAKLVEFNLGESAKTLGTR